MKTISRFEELKILSHPLRLEILRHLMARPATLSQLGAHFNQSPAHIRHHLKILETAGMVEFTGEPAQQNHLEKYYRAASEAWLINLALIPRPRPDHTTLVIGSKDLATRQMARFFDERRTGIALQVLPLNSIDSLMMLYQGLCQMSTCHLREAGTGEYNRPYVRHIFPGKAMTILRLFLREEGLMLPPGNPRDIRQVDDLARPDIVMVNREPGAGIRIWLDQSLAAAGIPTEMIRGYDSTVDSHAGVAEAVRSGRADVGLGIAACAREAGLDFIPLFDEPYELVMPAEMAAEARYAPFFDHIASAQYRRSILQNSGYILPATTGSMETIS